MDSALYSAVHLLSTLATKLSTLDVQHQVSPTNVLHDKIYPSLRLEACVQVQKERMPFFVGYQEDPLLRFRAFNFIVLDDEFFLENFDGIQLLGCLRLREHDFTKITLP